MLDHQLQRDEGILVLRPDGPLRADDLAALTGALDSFVGEEGPLRGVFIYARTFPMWEEFGALLTHLKFLEHRHPEIEKVAVVAGTGFPAVMPHVESGLIRPQIKYFSRNHEFAAWEWLMDNKQEQARTAA